MFGIVRIAGLSAILASGVVAALEVSQAREAAPVAHKRFTERVEPSDAGTVPHLRAPAEASRRAEFDRRAHEPGSGKRDRLRSDASGACAAQTWPNIERECLVPAEGTPIRKAVRTVTLETREGANVSVLARVPVTEIARR